MLEEYDFSKGIQGKYAKRYTEGANVVVIEIGENKALERIPFGHRLAPHYNRKRTIKCQNF
ncbi:MAG: hypothetical protein A2Z50_00080 [Nitrospirae bacterium RBG_19FT_COMBO_42_15]|nr:MAG: hypothetical protein A2Z50_00080 [Nitrospirae bacterium RBG_19FT_COMBO_42_15]